MSLTQIKYFYIIKVFTKFLDWFYPNIAVLNMVIKDIHSPTTK